PHLFLSLHRHHPTLPSFPTRRSSDLVRLPSVLSLPLKASVTFLEATTPVKLPTKQCPPHSGVRNRIQKGRYFKGDSTDPGEPASDRKSTRLNSSHVKISYAVFCLKKK